jgi:hypothetical protein
MPKIVINEYDLSKAGTVPYANFSVVVPGFLADDKYTLVVDKEAEYNEDKSVKTPAETHYELSEEAKAVFDENGIYECSSQLDFINNVGKKSAIFTSLSVDKEPKAPIVSVVLKLDTALIPAKEAKAKTIYMKNADGTDDTNKPFKSYIVKTEATTDTEAEYYDILATYTYDKDGKVTKTTYSYAKPEEFTEAFRAAAKGKDFSTTPLPKVETTDANVEKPNLYYAEAATNREVGELKTLKLTFKQVDTTTNVVSMPDEEEVAESGILPIEPELEPLADTYYILAQEGTGTTGTFVEDRIAHYGNQMAYELLGLGYTVLFKAMMPYTAEQLSALAQTSDNKKADGTNVSYLVPEKSAVAQINDGNFWECLKDKATYDFRYLVTGLLTQNDRANKCILEIADHTEEILLDDASIQDGRGDCIALIDLDSKTYVGKTPAEAVPDMAKEAAEWASAYAAVFAPYVTYLMSDDPDYDNKTFPASFHYLACAANSANNNFSEWYANAGYTRGVAKYTIESTGCKFGEAAIQALEPRFMIKVGKEKDATGTAWIDINTTVAINLIVKIKSSYYLWGNRTGKKLGTRGAADGDLRAQDFLNIRQLCCTIKKQVYVTCRRLTFDPNSNNLWINFRSLLTPMLEEMKADQGIKDYKFVKNDTDRKALLSAKIRIVPIEAVEDFEIGLYLEDTLDDVALTEA